MSKKKSTHTVFDDRWKKVLKNIFKLVVLIVDRAIWTFGALMLVLLIIVYVFGLWKAYDFDVDEPNIQTTEDVDIND